LCATVAALIGWTALPVVAYGVGRYIDQWRAWLNFFYFTQGVGKMNVSVFAMIDRIVGHRLIPFSVPGVDNMAASGSPLVRAVGVVALAVVTATACWMFRGPYDPSRRSSVAEWSIVLVVSAIFSPLTWKFYLIVLLLPMTLFVATWRDPATDAEFRRRLRLLTWLSFGLGMAAATDIVGHEFAWRMEMGSLLTMMTLLGLATLFWYRFRIQSVGGDKLA